MIKKNVIERLTEHGPVKKKSNANWELKGGKSSKRLEQMQRIREKEISGESYPKIPIDAVKTQL
jgi:hypothetical protein